MCVCVCVCVCVRVRVCIHIYVYIYILSRNAPAELACRGMRATMSAPLTILYASIPRLSKKRANSEFPTRGAPKVYMRTRPRLGGDVSCSVTSLNRRLIEVNQDSTFAVLNPRDASTPWNTLGTHQKHIRNTLGTPCAISAAINVASAVVFGNTLNKIEAHEEHIRNTLCDFRSHQRGQRPSE